jgi:hypothetical protein
MQSACAVLYCDLSHVWLYHIFPHYLINGTIRKKIIEYKMCVLIFSTSLSVTFLIQRIQRDIIINICKSSCKVQVILVGCEWNFNFLDTFSRNLKMSNFIKISPVGAELFHADRQT